MKRAFAPFDPIVYLLICALVLFAGFTGGGAGEEYLVSVGGERVCTLKNGEVEINSVWRGRVKTAEEGGAVRITVEAGGGFNEIEWRAGKIRMSNADCSAHKDCTRMFPLSAENSVPIVCVPHRLKIERANAEFSPVAG